MTGCADCFRNHWSWKECSGIAHFYAPADICFCRNQTLWIIENGPFDGEWPRESKETGYEGSNHSRTFRAPFENAAMIGGEVNWRLARTGLAGKLLVTQVRAQLYPLEAEARDALNYVSGWKRKTSGFKSWLKQRTYRARLVTGKVV